jgi:hypothetical protein
LLNAGFVFNSTPASQDKFPVLNDSQGNQDTFKFLSSLPFAKDEVMRMKPGSAFPTFSLGRCLAAVLRSGTHLDRVRLSASCMAQRSCALEFMPAAPKQYISMQQQPSLVFAMYQGI